MKKLLILSIALFTLFSCSSDDEPAVTTDPVIGTWTLFSNNENDSGNNEEVDDCQKRSTITFNQDNTTSDTFYDIIDNSCTADGPTIGVWENKGNNIYSVQADDEGAEEGEEQGEEEEEATLIFSNNNNTMTVSSTDDEGTFTAVYHRVN